MYILGVNAFYHDASAALLKDGRIIAMAEEERFTRNKHACGAFPHHAIEYCMKHANISFADISHLTFMHDIEAILANDPTIEPFKSYFLTNPETYALFKDTFSRHLRYIRDYCATNNIELAVIPHHDCHIASAFFGSDFEEANIISIDGRGDAETAVLAHGKGSEIKKLLSVPMPHSLGLLYTAVTNFLGFRPFDGEGKVMGLAPYGKNRFKDFFSEVISPTSHGFETVPDYYYPLTGGFLTGNCRMEEVFGRKRPAQSNSVNGVDEDIAYSLQNRTEEIVAHLADMLFSITGCRNLCLAGGVALNAKMNGKLLRKDNIDNIYIQPIANDAGCAIGGPMHLFNSLTGRRPNSIDHLYLGPEFTNDEIKNILVREGMGFGRSDDIAFECAKMLADGKIVGWYQGRMEVGPRALGNRSILANPADPAMKDKMNYKVKRREAWRPFASSMLSEYKDLYLKNACDAQFMILNFEVTEKAAKDLISGIHIDNTTRPQTVSEASNPRYHALISEFGKMTGVHAVLNTSFNLAGEPIVLTPQQAINDFRNCEMDCLVIGDFYLEKRVGKRAFSTGFSVEKEGSHLSFDQYQRYRGVADIIQGLKTVTSCRILDIGSGRCDLGEFLPYDSIMKLDKGDIREPNLIQGDATDMPFKDGHFDFVVSCDCFEHLSAEDRDRFLAEATRVSKGHVIIACPFSGNEVEEGEKSVDDYCRYLFGESNYNLREHEEAGLPSLQELLDKAGSMGCSTTVFENGYLEHWLPMMFLNFYLENTEQWEVFRTINDLYNVSFYHSDNNSPAYRQIVVIGKQSGTPESLTLPNEKPASISRVSGSLYERIQQSIREDIERLGTVSDADDGKIADIVRGVTIMESSLDSFRNSVNEFIASHDELPRNSARLLEEFTQPFQPVSSDILRFTTSEVNKNKVKAFKVLSELVKSRPDYGEAWNDLGAIFLSENELENAKKALLNACLLEYHLAYRNLSALYLVSGDTASARALAGEAVRKGIDPGMFSDMGLSE